MSLEFHSQASLENMGGADKWLRDRLDVVGLVIFWTLFWFEDAV